MRKQIVLFFNAVLVCSCVCMFTAWIIYLEMFFSSLNEFSAATVTGFGFCCHWRQKCWPFQAVDHIFHLILVCSDESKAVISPPTAERVGAQVCHPPPFHRAGVNAGATLYEWLFLPGAHGAPQLSGSPPACLLAASDEYLVEKTRMDSDHLGLYAARLCACVLHSASGLAGDAGLVVCLNRVFKDCCYFDLMILIQ